MTDTLLSLAERCERAGASEQGRMLMLARKALAAAKLLDYGTQARCLKFCEAEAYESAALTLVPEGWSKAMDDADNGDGLCRLETDETQIYSRGKTWALALCAAALRSRAATEGQTDG